MSRTVEAIEAEILEIENGEKKNPAKLGALRKELIPALRADLADAKLQLAFKADEAAAEPKPAESFDGDVFNTPHWAFIEKSCAKLEMDLTSGMRTGLAKKIYNQIKHKYEAWLVMREIVSKNCIKAFPQWATLGRDADTGNVMPVEEAKPEVAVERHPEAVSRSGPSREAILQQFGL